MGGRVRPGLDWYGRRGYARLGRLGKVWQAWSVTVGKDRQGAAGRFGSGPLVQGRVRQGRYGRVR